MRSVIFLGGVALSSAILLADTKPLDIKTGLWQITMTSTVTGMGAPQTRTYKSCLKKEDLNKYPFTDPDDKCTYTVVSSTGAKMEAHGTCMRPDAKIDFELTLEAADSETVKGIGKMIISAAGTTMNGNYAGAGKWIGATCPAGMK